MGILLASGVAIIHAIDIAAKTSGNKIIEAALYKTRTEIIEGSTVAHPISESGLFPPMV